MSLQLPASPLPADLRLRLVAGLLVLVLITPLSHPGPAALALGLGLALAASAPAFPWHRLVHLEAFVVLLLLTVPFTVPGRAVLVLGPFTASAEGGLRALVLGAKVTASVLWLTRLFAGVAPEDLGRALARLHLPGALIRIYLGLVRYLGLIRSEMGRLAEAMRLRGFQPGTNRHTWRSYGHLIGMMLLRALSRAERVEEAMRLRGGGGIGGGSAAALALAPVPARTRRGDWALAGLWVLGAALILIWDRT